MSVFTVGSVYDSFEEFMKAKNEYENCNNIILVIRSSIKLKESDSNFNRLKYASAKISM